MNTRTLGYGLRRSPKRLRDAGAHVVVIDKGDDREKLQELREDMGLAIREGDTILLASTSDLGARPARLLKCLADWNVSVQVIGHEPVLPDTKERRDYLMSLEGAGGRRKPKQKLGRPRVFDPTPDQAKLIVAIWETEGVMPKFKVKQISALMGRPVKYHHVRDWYARQKRH